MKVGDLVTVQKKHGVVDEGIIVGVENSGNCFKMFEVMCFGTSRLCNAHSTDLKKISEDG